MSTVHCPKCHRALLLPRDREVTAARCPMCATDFDVPGGHAPLPALPIPVPTQTIPPVPLPRDPSIEPLAFPSDNEVEAPAEVASRRAINGAASWMKAAAVLGVTQMTLCGCCDFWEADLFRGLGGDYVFVLVVVMLGVRLVALLVIWSATDSLRRRQSVGYIRFAARVAVALGVYMLWRSRVGWFVLFDVPIPRVGVANEPVFFLLYGLGQAVVAVPAIVGGIWTLALLGRPTVRKLYNR